MALRCRREEVSPRVLSGPADITKHVVGQVVDSPVDPVVRVGGSSADSPTLRLPKRLLGSVQRKMLFGRSLVATRAPTSARAWPAHPPRTPSVLKKKPQPVEFGRFRCGQMPLGEALRHRAAAHSPGPTRCLRNGRLLGGPCLASLLWIAPRRPLKGVPIERFPRRNTSTRIPGEGYVGEEDADHVAILRENTVVYRIELESQAGISSIVDRLVAEPKKFNDFGADGY